MLFQQADVIADNETTGWGKLPPLTIGECIHDAPFSYRGKCERKHLIIYIAIIIAGIATALTANCM